MKYLKIAHGTWSWGTGMAGGDQVFGVQIKYLASQSVPVRFERNAVPDTTIPCLKFA